jgi:hypothetical protein
MPTIVVDPGEQQHLTPAGCLERGQFLLATRYRCHHLRGTFWEDPYGATVVLTARGMLRNATGTERGHLFAQLRHRGAEPHCPGCARCEY